MRAARFWRTTTFRLTTLFGVVFVLGVVAALGFVYLRTAQVLTSRDDRILASEMADLQKAAQGGDLADTITARLKDDDGSVTYYGLFSPDGDYLAGNLSSIPPQFRLDGRPHDLHIGGPEVETRAVARRERDGRILLVGRDVTHLLEIRNFTFATLLWSGVLIVVLGMAAGVALGVSPLRRLQSMQEASEKIMGGALHVRMPVLGRDDELDLFAGTVNLVLEEVEWLMKEVKSVSDAIAHDLRTPLTHVRAILYRLQEEPDLTPEQSRRLSAEAAAKLDVLLERFRALLRISELEAQEHRAAYRPTNLAAITAQAVDLYEPLAEERGVELISDCARLPPIQADPALMFEALSNLVDNALKFTPEGGCVQVRLDGEPDRQTLRVIDSGPGVPEEMRHLVTQRFFRGEDSEITGHGLGLSIVSAIARRHRFQLSLHDAAPGLEARLDCWVHA